MDTESLCDALFDLFGRLPSYFKPKREGDFSRKRLLPLSRLVPLVFFLAAGGKDRKTDTKLSEFFLDARHRGIWDWGGASAPHRSAVTQARAKLGWEPFAAIHRDLVSLAYRSRPALGHETFKGHTVLAIDGSDYRLPATAAMREAFDPGSGLGRKGGGHYPQCLVSTLYDVLRHWPVARSVAPARTGERAEAMALLESAPRAALANAILLLDQGYAGHETMEKWSGMGLGFLQRNPAKNTFPAVEAFLAGGDAEAMLVLAPPRESSARRFRETGRRPQPFRVRAIRLDHPDGTVSALLTNLVDADRYPARDLVELYMLRWGVESHYCQEKFRFGLEKFHSRSPDGVRQELYAVLSCFLTARLLADPPQDGGFRQTRRGEVQPMDSHAFLLLARFAYLLTPEDPAAALAIFLDVVGEMRRAKYHRPKLKRAPQPRINKSPPGRWHGNSRMRRKKAAEKKLKECRKTA
jgi:hypothetical protein